MIETYTGFVYKKRIDWSLLHEGTTIPITIQQKFLCQATGFLNRGQSKTINLILEGKTYKAKLINQLFDSYKYKNRSDIIQIRYNSTSDIAIEIRKIFIKSFEYLRLQKEIAKENGIKKNITLPDKINESIAILTTEYPDTYALECFTENDYGIIKEFVSGVQEQDFEYSVNYDYTDPKASIEQKKQLVKVRKLNRAIGECLKELYDDKCQICGVNISLKYHAAIVESHHLDPFVTSLNNDSNNQIIVCPNHHRIIHKAEPVFERERLTFVYKNGLEEKIVLNQHLI